jgi:UDP-N-acetylglucosamine transferase subunit ALG13
MHEKAALVTVGTTKFDDLIRGIDSVELLEALKRQGFCRLIIQHGNGTYKLRNIKPCPIPDFTVQCAFLSVLLFMIVSTKNLFMSVFSKIMAM